jgi:hypothetical protein
MNTSGTCQLLIDPASAQVATPDIQREANCDADIAWRFPLGAMTTTVTGSMGIFTLSHEHVDALVRRAREQTSSEAMFAV